MMNCKERKGKERKYSSDRMNAAMETKGKNGFLPQGDPSHLAAFRFSLQSGSGVISFSLIHSVSYSRLND